MYLRGGAGKTRKHKRNRLVDKFCRCVKAVSATVKVRGRVPRGKKGQAAESAAFGICTKSVLQTRKKTLFKARCTKRTGGPSLQTQKPLGPIVPMARPKK